MVNIMVGMAKLYFLRLLYSPDSGVLKSGIPHAVDMPAPVSTKTCFAAMSFYAIYSTSGTMSDSAIKWEKLKSLDMR